VCLTATRLLAIFLRSISKQRAQPMQLLRPGFGPLANMTHVRPAKESTWRLQ
jgi:hypothetical protein